MSSSSLLPCLFDKAQRSSQCHGYLVKSAIELFKNISLDEFSQKFCNCTIRILNFDDKSDSVKRCFEFIAKFMRSIERSIAEKDDEDKENMAVNDFIGNLFDLLITACKSNKQICRARSCELIGGILEAMDDDTELDERMLSNVRSALLVCLKDKVSHIRAKAATGLLRLQDPSHKNCPVVTAYIQQLGIDPKSEVRLAILQHIHCSQRTLQYILERTRDVDCNVRIAAYTNLADKVHIRSLTIAQRVEVLKEGLNDRSVKVRSACAKKLLLSWMKALDNDMLRLLKCLDVERSQDLSKQCLEVLFRENHPKKVAELASFLGNDQLVPMEFLTVDQAFFWRVICQYLQSNDNGEDDLLENLLPDLPPLCNLIHKYIESDISEDSDFRKSEKEFIVEQLIHMISLYSLSDTAERQRFLELFGKLVIMRKCSLPLLSLLTKQVRRAFTDPYQGFKFIADRFTEIQDMLDPESAWVNEDENCALLDDDSEQEESLKTSTSEVLLRCLTIFCEVLKWQTWSSSIAKCPSHLKSLILPGIQNANQAARQIGIRALGLYCTSVGGREMSSKYVVLLLQAAQVDVVSVRILALQALFDIILVYGMKIFNDLPSVGKSPSEATSDDDDDDDDEDEEIWINESFKQPEADTPSAQLLNVLYLMLRSEACDIRRTTAEGLAKLFINGHISSTIALSKLILMWFNPTTKTDNYLSQMLGAFLTTFANMSRANRSCIADAFIPVVDGVLNAPMSSPLHAMNVNDIFKFLSKLTDCNSIEDVKTGTELVESVHVGLALKICAKILDSPEDVNVNSWIKALSYFDVTSGTKQMLTMLNSSCVALQEEIFEKSAEKIIEKFQNMVKTSLSKVKSASVSRRKRSGSVDNVPSSVTQTDKTNKEKDPDLVSAQASECSRNSSPENDMDSSERLLAEPSGKQRHSSSLGSDTIPPTPPFIAPRMPYAFKK